MKLFSSISSCVFFHFFFCTRVPNASQIIYIMHQYKYIAYVNRPFSSVYSMSTSLSVCNLSFSILWKSSIIKVYSPMDCTSLSLGYLCESFILCMCLLYLIIWHLSTLFFNFLKIFLFSFRFLFYVVYFSTFSHLYHIIHHFSV